MMTRRALVPLVLLAFTAACGDQGGEADVADDSVTAVVPDVPRNPRVMAIDVGLAADSLGRVVGGTYEAIQEADTIFVGVRTQYVPAGTAITVRLQQGERTVESVDVTSGTPDADGVARALATLPAAATAARGSYQVEVLLDGVSQGLRPLAIGAQ